MATQVTTWTEFVNAFVSNSITEIDIMNDLDCNEDLPTAQIRAGTTKTISGNYHTIWNLSTGAVVNAYLINADGRSITWSKVNFNNIYRNESYPVFHGYSNPIIFNDCTFVAKCPDRLFDIATLNRCAVTFTGSSHVSPFLGVTANYCWIKYEHKRNINNTNPEFTYLNTCYLEGKITTDLSSYSSAFDFSYSIDSCVINVETDLPVHLSSNSDTTRPVTVYNTDKISNYTGSLSFVKGVTDTQMKDASYLSSVGFNIIV